MKCVQHSYVQHVPVTTAGRPQVSGATAVQARCRGSTQTLPSATNYPITRHRRSEVATFATMQEAPLQTLPSTQTRTMLCTSVTASTFDQAIAEIHQIAEAGADLIELRLDMLKGFDTQKHLKQLINTTDTPKLVTVRPEWEGCGLSCWNSIPLLSTNMHELLCCMLV